MKKQNQIIAIDMDGVLADIETHFLNWYEKKYQVVIAREQLLGKPEAEAFPERGAVGEFVVTNGFFRSIPVMPGAVEAVIELMKTFEVYVVSAAVEFPQSLTEKLEWLNEHFPFISWKNIVFCGDKSIIKADYMIDDHCKNLDSFNGKTLMFHASHNANKVHHQRVHSWDEIVDILKVVA